MNSFYGPLKRRHTVTISAKVLDVLDFSDKAIDSEDDTNIDNLSNGNDYFKF